MLNWTPSSLGEGLPPPHTHTHFMHSHIAPELLIRLTSNILYNEPLSIHLDYVIVPLHLTEQDICVTNTRVSTENQEHM